VRHRRGWFLSVAAVLTLGMGAAPTTVDEAAWQIEVRRLPVAALVPWLRDDDAATRARAARAVGRLRQESDVLGEVADDADSGVRLEAAFALGQVPGTIATLRSRWAAEDDPSVRAALAVAIGKQGEAADVNLLLGALDGPGAGGAAQGIGRLGYRKVEGVATERVADALLGVLHRPLGEARRDAAWALSRLGLGSASPAFSAELRSRARGDHDPEVRAWLTRAAGGLSVGRRGEAAVAAAFLAEMAADRDPVVRLAALRAMAKQVCDPRALDQALDDPDAGVRGEALAAAADCRESEVPRLLRFLQEGSDVEKAAAVTSLAKRKVLPGALSTYTEAPWPTAVRVAAVAATPDRKRLMQWARRDPEAAIRSAAAGAIVEADPVRGAELVELVSATDPIVAQAATDALREHPEPAAEAPLLDLLRQRDCPKLLGVSAAKALDAIYATGRLPRPGPAAADAISRWLGAPELGAAAQRLATLLQLPPPRVQHATTKLPSLAEARRVRSARIFVRRAGKVEELRAELFSSEAPLTTWNFASLADAGYFDGLKFHRVVPGFVIQGGDPRGDGWGGPGYEIPDEINAQPYTDGTLGMALGGPDTGGSQWFVTLGRHPHLDGTYTVFGRVTYGMEVVRSVQVGDVIERIVIERVGP
jgi:cyclophilin family peptidyl-prolyl cis-trans isomerase